MSKKKKLAVCKVCLQDVQVKDAKVTMWDGQLEWVCTSHFDNEDTKA